MCDGDDGEALVLLVEDEVGIRRVLTELLVRDGFRVADCSHGAEVPDHFVDDAPDLVILDLGLPDMSGFDVLARLREHTDVPVIVLSGWSDEGDRVRAFDAGADDYVVKPFLAREIVARVRARLRRPAARDAAPDEDTPGDDGAPGAMSVGDDSLRIDARTRDVVLDGVHLTLTAKEFDLLHHLASAPRQVFSREQLLDAVWQSTGEWQADATVTEHVHRLRQKVGAERIATVRGVGYRFEPAATPPG